MKKCKNGKTQYKTEKQANRARMYILSHDPSANMLDLLPYTCPICGFFHVGHRSKHILSIQRGQTATETKAADNDTQTAPLS